MTLEDEWGYDPSVQRMRRVFSYIETAQQKLLEQLKISLFDQRLRRGREQALELFEKAWPLALRKGMIMSEKDAVPLYTQCLVRALGSMGVELPENSLREDEKIIRLLQEELP